MALVYLKLQWPLYLKLQGSTSNFMGLPEIGWVPFEIALVLFEIARFHLK